MAKRGYKLQEFVAHASDVNCIHIGKKSCRVFVTGGADRKVNLWSIGKSTSLLSLSGHTSSVQSVTLDAAEVLVLAGSSNGPIKLWDLEEAKIVRTLTGHRSNCTAVEFHPFGEFFASGSLDTDLKIWDIRKKGCIHTYKGHTQGIRSIKFTPDGRWVVTGGEDNVVKLWDLTAGKLLHDFKFHSGPIRCINFHPHEFLLATGSADRTVKFWDLETFELIGSAGPETTGVRSIVFHPDGKTLFCGLDEILKVFSWEPIRCHDIVEMGWSTLGDLNIYEEKLWGCSYQQSHVGVWVADTALIGPYAANIMPQTNVLTEHLYSYGDYHSVELAMSSTISSKKLVVSPIDCGNLTKDAVKSPCMTSIGCCQSVQQETNHASNMTPTNQTEFQKSSTTLCYQTTPPKFDSGFLKKPSLNSTTFRSGKVTENHRATPNRSDSSSAARDMSLRSNTSRPNSSSTRKKGPVIEANALNKNQALSRSFSMPMIVPRDRPHQETAASSRKVTAIAVATQGTIPCESNHSPMSPFVGGSSQNKPNTTSSEPLSSVANTLFGTSSHILSRVAVDEKNASANEQDHSSIINVAERFGRIMLEEQPEGLNNDKHVDSPCSSRETSSVKYVRGVAVPLGKTRSLVERWERREICNSNCTSTSSSSDRVDTIADFPTMQKGQNQTFEGDMTSANDYVLPETLLQDHDEFLDIVKSRLLKLQVVRHFWDQNGINGALNAVAKLADHSVQVDVLSIFRENIGLFTLDLFSCSLPMLAGLLNSNTERYVAICLEILLELVKILGPVIRSTISASSLLGVDLQGEQRLERCNQCFNHLEKIKRALPSLIRRGGLLAEQAQELTLILQDL